MPLPSSTQPSVHPICAFPRCPWSFSQSDSCQAWRLDPAFCPSPSSTCSQKSFGQTVLGKWSPCPSHPPFSSSCSSRFGFAIGSLLSTGASSGNTTSRKRCLKPSETEEAYWTSLLLPSFSIFLSPKRSPHAVSTVSRFLTILGLFLIYAYPIFRFTSSSSYSIQFEITKALCCAQIALSWASYQTQLSCYKSQNLLSRLIHWTNVARTPLSLELTLSSVTHSSFFYCFRQPNQECLTFSILQLVYHSEWTQIASYLLRLFLTFKFKFCSSGLPLRSFVGQS